MSAATNRLALGSAQFGLDYGIANVRGQVPPEAVAAILDDARSHGMDTIDTAIAYGDAERRLGEAGIGWWKMVTKLPSIPGDCRNVGEWITSSVEQSLLRLRIPCLHGLLLHNPLQLLESDGEKISKALAGLKRDGLVEKTGISIYDSAELDALVPRFPVDLVQAPFNILDRRLARSGWMKRLHEQGVELHVRSIFLQGLLLMGAAERDGRFGRWRSLWSRLETWLEHAGSTPLEACVGFALSFPEIHRIVIGIDSLSQLREIFSAAGSPVPVIPDDLFTDDLDLLNPARWAAS